MIKVVVRMPKTIKEKVIDIALWAFLIFVMILVVGGIYGEVKSKNYIAAIHSVSLWVLGSHVGRKLAKMKVEKENK